MDKEFIKAKYEEGKKAGYTNMIILKNKLGEDMCCVFIGKSDDIAELITGFAENCNFDYIVLFSLETEIDSQIKTVEADLKAKERERKKQEKEYEKQILKLRAK